MKRERPRSVRVMTGAGWCCQSVMAGREDRGRFRRTSKDGSTQQGILHPDGWRYSVKREGILSSLISR